MEDWWDRPVRRACVLSSEVQHHITQINRCGCEGRTAPSLWSLIKGTCDMFIRVHVSVHALAVQVREIAHFALVLNQTQLHQVDRSPRWKNGGAGTVRAVPTSAADTAGSSELKKKTV